MEAAELVSTDAATAREVERAVEAVGLERVMFELPGPWIASVSESNVHQFRRRLIDRYGADVNLGNVAPGDLLSLEAYRRGLGVNACGAKKGRGIRGEGSIRLIGGCVSGTAR